MNNYQLPLMGIIENKILCIRDTNVMLDYDLATLYEVETKRINEQVKRNQKRFPSDFMFQLSENEFDNLKSQFATSSWGGRRKPPYAFTEHGVLMLSSVLKSDRAIAVNIQIMRVYIQLRELLLSDNELKSRVDSIEESISTQNNKILSIVDYLKKKEVDNDPPRKRMGYKK